MSGSIQASLRFSGLVVLEKKILKIFSLSKHMQKQFPLLWSHTTSGGHNFYKLDFALCQKAFAVLSFSDPVVLENKIFKIFS
jgi:hypothetical protein